MQKERILIVEDDDDIRELVSHVLKSDGYEIRSVVSGEDALREARYDTPDLVLLDLMLPGIDGLDVCRSLKFSDKTKKLPIVILTAKGEEADIVAGLELGADDYITKPFSTRVLTARIKAVLRRRTETVASESNVLQINEINIDPEKHEVKIGSDTVELTSTEFKLLHLLARRPGKVLTRSQIVDGVHGDDYPVTERSVDVQIVGLRKKLGKIADDYIETVRGVGYRFRNL